MKEQARLVVEEQQARFQALPLTVRLYLTTNNALRQMDMSDESRKVMVKLRLSYLGQIMEKPDLQAHLTSYVQNGVKNGRH